jgi:hypothetical protein
MIRPSRPLVRFRTALLAAALSLALLDGSCGVTLAPPVRSPEQCGPAQARAPWAVPDEAFNRLFTRSGDGWTGGDGTSSVPLPDGRMVWMFGDTFLGSVNPDRSRAPGSPLINNSFVVQDGDTLTTLYGGTASKPAALVVPADGSSWYWPGAGVVEKDVLRVFLWRFKRTGAGAWDWVWSGTDIGSFSLPEIHLGSVVAAPTGGAVMYGSGVLEDRKYTYIYGTEDLKAGKFAHVARSTRGDLLGKWEFFTGAGWSDDPAASARILEGVANQYSVVRLWKRYVLITMDNRKPFAKEVVAYRSTNPWGPWRGPTQLYTAPESSPSAITYNAQAHPQLGGPTELLVSYNVNTLGGFEPLFANADGYRPRFIRVNLCRLFDEWGSR